MARRGAIDRLEEPVRAAVDKLIREGHTTVAIGEHLTNLGKPVSYAALGRYRRRLEAQLARYREAQAIAGAWVSALNQEPGGDVGRLLAELLKIVALKTLSQWEASEDETDPKDIVLIARTIRELEAAGKLAMERETALTRRAGDQAAAVAGQEAKKAGFELSEDALKAIREQVYGVTGT
jgi:hypothetical protein